MLPFNGLDRTQGILQYSVLFQASVVSPVQLGWFIKGCVDCLQFMHLKTPGWIIQRE
jgi:hypothetical protein